MYWILVGHIYDIAMGFARIWSLYLKMFARGKNIFEAETDCGLVST